MGYRTLIIESTGCSPLAAAEVEEVMRDTYHTLDGLNRKAFMAAAKRAYKVVLAEKKPPRHRAHERVRSAALGRGGIVMGYRTLIIESTGCSPLAAAEVEEVMRDTYHTLDGLNRKAFMAAAKRAYKVVLAEKKR